MYQSLKVFQTSNDMARHAGTRQALTAQNIANADTPGYVARQIAPFADIYQDQAAPMRATRTGHIDARATGPSARSTPTAAEPAPNGNAVSLEEEMFNAVEVAREHSRALTIYRHAMTVLRISLGR